MEQLAGHCDLVVVVGGDGSLLHAAQHIAEVPVIGVNRGRLGFLTDVLPDEIESRLGEVLAGKYLRERRFLLEAEVRRGGPGGASRASRPGAERCRGCTPASSPR